MWIYTLTGQKFKTRKEAKLVLGSGFANGAIKHGDLIFINDSTSADYGNTIHQDTKEVS